MFGFNFDFSDGLAQHQRRGARRSVFTVFREIRRSNIRRETGYMKRSRTNKSYAKQAKGFREWTQTPAQLARLNANLAAAAAEKRSDAQR